jgi:hypothetical protein
MVAAASNALAGNAVRADIVFLHGIDIQDLNIQPLGLMWPSILIVYA